MTYDQRMTWDFIIDVLDVFERHGYRRSNNQHTGQAIGLIGPMARIYEGTTDDPRGTSVVTPASPQAPSLAGQGAVTVSAVQAKTLLAALDDAAEYNRDQTATCADRSCVDRSCGTCQRRLQAVQAYDRMAGQLRQTTALPQDAAGRPHEPERTTGLSAQPDAADKEAGR